MNTFHISFNENIQKLNISFKEDISDFKINFGEFYVKHDSYPNKEYTLQVIDGKQI